MDDTWFTSEFREALSSLTQGVRALEEMAPVLRQLYIAGEDREYTEALELFKGIGAGVGEHLPLLGRALDLHRAGQRRLLLDVDAAEQELVSLVGRFESVSMEMNRFFTSMTALENRLTAQLRSAHDRDEAHRGEEGAAQNSDAVGGAGAVASSSIRSQRSSLKRHPLVSLGVGGVLVLTLVGVLNGYSHEVVDQEGRWEKRATEEYDIVRSGNCAFATPGCLDRLIDSYNSACVGRTLTPAGLETCREVEESLTREVSYWETCGYDCEPAPLPETGTNPTWRFSGARGVGSSFLDVVPVTRNFNVPEVIHTERCYFNLGPFELGSCL